MGRYISQSDLTPALVAEEDLVYLTNDTPGAVEVRDDVLDDAIEQAEAEVDLYVGRRYQLPLSTVPGIVKKLTARLARWNLYTARPGSPEEWLAKDYDRAVKLLEKVASGAVTIGLTIAGADPGLAEEEGHAVRATGRDRVFGRDNLDGF